MALGAAFRSRDFALLLWGQLLSFLGDGIGLAVITAYVVTRNGSPLSLAVVLLSQFLPGLLVSLPAGAVADRVSRARVLIVTDLTRAVAVGAMAALALAGRLDIPVLVTLTAVGAAAGSFFAPAFSALVRQLLPDDELVGGNALVSLGRPFMTRLLGAALGSLLLALDAVPLGLALNAASFVVGAVCVALIRLPRVPRPAPAPPPPAPGQPRRRHDLGLLGRLERDVRLVIAGDFLVLLAYWGPYQVTAPFVIQSVARSPGPAIAWFLTAGGLGAIIGSLVASRLRVTGRAPRTTLLLWAVGAAAPVVWGLAGELWPFMVATVVANACFTIGNVLFTTVVQRRVPERQLGRAFGLVYFLERLAVPVSVLAAGAVPAAGGRPLLLGAGVLGTLLAAALIGAIAVRGRRLGHGAQKHLAGRP